MEDECGKPFRLDSTNSEIVINLNLRKFTFHLFFENGRQINNVKKKVEENTFLSTEANNTSCCPNINNYACLSLKWAKRSLFFMNIIMKQTSGRPFFLF